MTKKFTLFILASFALNACNDSKQVSQAEKISSQQIDTTKAIRIGDYWVAPKPAYEFNSLSGSSKDTLKIVVCAEFVYSPFGTLTDKSKLPVSKLRNFKIQDRVDEMDVGKLEFQILMLKSSRLILFFDSDPEATKHSPIFKGEINDSEVNFINSVRVGMSKKDFINIFFDDFPAELLTKYNYIIFDSCIQDIRHTYAFKDNKLKSINFKTDSYWTVNYE